LSDVEVADADVFPPGSSKLVQHGSLYVGVYNCGGTLYAIEDRCSHDDGPLCEGDWDEDECRVICPRHGSAFDLATGAPRTLPVVDGRVVVELPG
jgi:3-phenylpropionate/trans-cinnamate dioxygenase ferredoxin subunit